MPAPHPDIYVSIMTEFAENQEEAEKQDCEQKAFYHLISRLRNLIVKAADIDHWLLVPGKCVILGLIN